MIPGACPRNTRLTLLRVLQGNSSPGPSETLSHLGIDDTTSGGTPSSTSSAPPKLPTQLNLPPQLQHVQNQHMPPGAYPSHHGVQGYPQAMYPSHHGVQGYPQAMYQGVYTAGRAGHPPQQGVYWEEDEHGRMMSMAQENEQLRNVISNLTQVGHH